MVMRRLILLSLYIGQKVVIKNVVVPIMVALFFIENLLEELDAPGEYFYDKEEKKL